LAEQQRAQQQTGPQPQQQQASQQQAPQPAVQQAQAQPQPQAQAQVVQQPQAVVQTAVTTVANTAVLVRKAGLGASGVVNSVPLCVLYLRVLFSLECENFRSA